MQDSFAFLHPSKKSFKLAAAGATFIAIAMFISAKAQSQESFLKSNPHSHHAINYILEIQKNFTINGRPIHPFVLRDFLGWMSDGLPIIVSIDVLAGDGSNYYFQGDIKQFSSSYFAKIGEETHGYSYIGKLDNNLLVVKASQNLGGSGTFVTLMILDVNADLAFDNDGNRYERVCLTTIRHVALGDRWNGSVEIRGNSVLLQDGESIRTIEATRP